MSGTEPSHVVALSGGIGGAKLALGLSRVLPPQHLTIVANTGDDFEHLGLSISPDIDTLMYTLAGVNNQEAGWGRRDETWTFMRVLRELGGDDWFNLGDGDLAVHVERTRRLRSGDRLTDITSDFCRASGVPCEVLPMSDQPIRTIVDTIDGPLPFQDYFVRLQCEPRIRGITFAGADNAQPSPEVLSALRDPRLRAVVICPSNPLISIDPILSVSGLRRAIAECPAPVVAVSPIVDGRALKGPTAKMLQELGVSASAASVADHYGDLLDAFVVEATDLPDSEGAGSSCEWHVAKTIMQTMADREDLARAVLLIADQVRPKSIQRKVTAQ